MRDWISVDTELPKEKQEVWYYFDICGVNHGYYETIIEDDEPDHKYQCFTNYSSPMFFLCDNVTHWMPYTKGDKEPDPPKED